MENKNNQSNQAYQVTEHGSLGLLALGDVGIKLWREARKKAKAEKEFKAKKAEDGK